MYDKCYFCLDQLPKLKKESTASFFVNFGRSRGTKEPTYITVLLFCPTICATHNQMALLNIQCSELGQNHKFCNNKKLSLTLKGSLAVISLIDNHTQVHTAHMFELAQCQTVSTAVVFGFWTCKKNSGSPLHKALWHMDPPPGRG